MTIKKRDLIYLLISIGGLWILYLGRAVLTPFLFAAAFAYLLNPVVTFLSHKIRLPRTLAISLIYILLIGGLGILVVTLWSRYAEESLQFTQETRNLIASAELQIASLPTWLQPTGLDLLNTFKHSMIFSPRKFISVLPGALNHLLSVLIFLIAAFYFLKDGHRFIDSSLNLLPNDLKFEAEVILRKVNQVLGNYLRAQILLVGIMASLTFVSLSALGVRYALILSIFTGIAETIPFAGPVAAAALAMVITYLFGAANLSSDPIMEVLIVGILYTVLRQLEDLFIIPQVLGRMTKLHPLLVLFAALLGGHLFGIVGFITAVPLVASLRVVLDHVLTLINK